MICTHQTLPCGNWKVCSEQGREFLEEIREGLLVRGLTSSFGALAREGERGVGEGVPSARE